LRIYTIAANLKRCYISANTFFNHKLLVMQKIIFSLILFTAFSACRVPEKGGITLNGNEVDVNLAFSAVYKATQEGLAESGSTSFTIESIDLSFQTTSTYSFEAGAKLWVLSGKYSKSHSMAKKATFTFKEAEHKEGLLKNNNTEDYRRYLVAVLKAAEGVQKIGQVGLADIEVEVEFTLTKKGETAAEIELSPITPSLGASREKEYVHTITLKLTRKPK
jgi:hypothetical protein